MIHIKQPALALHSCDVPGFRYRMSTTWNMPPGASAHDVAYWIGYAVDQTPELQLKNVVINNHGGPGVLYVGGGKSPAMTTGHLGVLKALRSKDIGTVWLVGCLVATGSNGMRFCSQLAVTLGCFVVAANDYQFVERRYNRAGTPYGTIDDFEGTAYCFSPSGSKQLYSIHDPQAEESLYS